MAIDLNRFFDLGKTGLRQEPCSLAELVDEAVRLLRPQCQHGRIDLIWKKPDAAGMVSGDSGQLGHLILNLLSNAVDAAGPGGTAEARLVQKESRWLFEVSDSGKGPPPDIGDRLFEPFVTGKLEGVGLGLFIAKQVAEAHGGSIHWSRESNRTAFRVELAMAREIHGR